MLTIYFRSLEYTKSAIDDFYIVESGNVVYYVCAYKDRNKGKTEIIASLLQLPSYRSMKAGDFDFHHLVEEQHLADISFSHRLSFYYGNMPTVLIHKGEHKRYNAILHTRETRNLYLRDQEKFTGRHLSSIARKQAAVRLFTAGTDTYGSTEISNRIKILKEVYDLAYEDNGVLKIIANNIFNEYRKHLIV